MQKYDWLGLANGMYKPLQWTVFGSERVPCACGGDEVLNNQVPVPVNSLETGLVAN